MTSSQSLRPWVPRSRGGSVVSAPPSEPISLSGGLYFFAIRICFRMFYSIAAVKRLHAALQLRTKNLFLYPPHGGSSSSPRQLIYNFKLLLDCVMCIIKLVPVRWFANPKVQ